MTLPAFLREVRRQWKLFVAVFIGVTVIAILLTLLVPNRSVSAIQLQVMAKGNTTASIQENLQLEIARVNSYIPLMSSEVVADRVVNELGLERAAADLGNDISAALVAGSNIIDARVRADNAEDAVRIADSLGRQFASYTAGIESPAGSDDQKVEVTVLGAASPATPQRPGPLVFGLLGALAGLVVASIAVWVRGRAEGVVGSVADAEAASGLRAVGPVEDPGSPRAGETYRALRTRMQSVQTQAPNLGSVWLVTGVDAADETTNVAVSLADACADANDSVLIVDAGSSGTVPESFGGTTGPSLTDALAGDIRLDEAIQRVDGRRFDVLSTGGDRADAAQLLASPTSSMHLVELRRRYRRVLVVCTEAARSSAVVAVVGSVAAVVVVAAIDRTRRRNLTRAADDMRSVGAEFAGLVLCAPVAASIVAGPPAVEVPASRLSRTSG